MAENTVVPCPNCKTKFSAPLDKFLPNGRQVRCSNCGHTWFHRPPGLPDRSGLVEEEPDEGVRYKADPSEFRDKVVERKAGRGGGFWSGLLWLIALGLLLAIIAYVFRPQLSQSFPSLAAPLERYSDRVDGVARGFLGESASISGRNGLELQSTKYDVRESETGSAVLVEAMVENTSDAERDAPQLRVRLIDGAGKALYETSIGPEDAGSSLAPGATTRYFIRIPEPPEGFEKVVVDLP